MDTTIVAVYLISLYCLYTSGRKKIHSEQKGVHRNRGRRVMSYVLRSSSYHVVS